MEGYDVERIQRVEYDWDTELDIKPPKAARPFDWLAVVRRRDGKVMCCDILTNNDFGA